MAAGAVFFSLPVAVLGTVQAGLQYRLGAWEALLVYSALGTATMLTVIAAICLAEMQGR